MKLSQIAFAAALMVSVSTAALAKDPTDGKSEGLAVEKMICQQLYVHKPADDVAYKPGVDVNGNAVAPADLPSSSAQIDAPDYIEVPMTVDLAQRLGQQVPQGVEMKGNIGNLRLYKDGRVNFNGQDLGQQASAMCGNNVAPAAAPNSPPAVTQPAPQQQSAPAPAPQQGSYLQAPITAPAAPVASYNTPDTPVAGSVVPSGTSNPAPLPKPGDPMEMAKQSANFTGKDASKNFKPQ